MPGTDTEAGGLSAAHPELVELPILAAPATKGEKNTIRMELIPIACWKIHDVRFEFGSSFVLPDAKPEFVELEALRKAHPGAPLSLFGHADPVGDDAFNKKLSGHRAESIYAVLLHDTARWEKLYTTAGANEGWGLGSVQQMLATLGFFGGPVTGTSSPNSTAAIKDFQSKNGVTPSGSADQATRAKLFAAYMAFLWPTALAKTDFLGEGADAGGKAAMQGCSEFNPAMVFSKSEVASLAKPDRDGQNSVNRRVLGLLFRPGSKVPVNKWPCPRVSEDAGGCKKRFWSDGEKRRANGDARREFKTTKDTFACRFYQRMVETSPCEVIPPVVPIELKLIKADDHFCPKAENLDIQYSLKGLSGKAVKLTITSAHAKANPLFERDLKDDEKTDGDHTINWDGKGTGGDLKDLYLHPLLSPYKVTLTHNATHQGSAEFKVLFHSVDLAKAPWTPDEKVPDEASKTDDWVQYQLNELGYFGGPIGKDFDKYKEKAIIRYKFNHKKMHTLKLTDTKPDITADLRTALKAGDNKRQWISDEAVITDPAKSANILVEAITREKGEGVAGDKAKFEKDRLNRPLIPIEAILKIKKKDDSAAVCPEAVGPARVNWRYVDTNEDLTNQFANTAAEPSETNKYLEKALKTKNGRAGDGDNCHDDFAGIRKGAADSYKTCFELGDKLLPYKVEDDAGQKAVFSKASIDAAEPNAKRLGRAGVFFRPSFIAADDYKLSAEIDFTGLPNAADLEKFHSYKSGDAKSRIRKETGTFRIRRFGKVAVNIDWPARTNGYDWPQIAAEFEKAYLDVDTAGVTTKLIKDVITEAEYVAVVHKQAAFAAAHAVLHDNAFTGLDTPAQTVPAATYQAALRTEYVTFQRAIREDLGDLIGSKLRPDFPAGFIVLTFMPRVPVDVKEDPGTGKNTVVNAGFIPGALSTSLDSGIILADQKDRDKVYYVVGHEMGHGYWLQHYENAPGSAPGEHDTNDHNCIMSYTPGALPHQAAGTYTPHFCGKCNLKLRGWNLQAAGLPANS
ncbi:MAG: peptidoglycan-binding protein [Acidobacteria bacterium]|nr:peptidoglycan-binding protein [Acidobacteriota bacterium]